jgi:hypothetical protein
MAMLRQMPWCAFQRAAEDVRRTFAGGAATSSGNLLTPRPDPLRARTAQVKCG